MCSPGFVGGIAGIPPITALDGPGSEGLSLRQHYTVTMVKNGQHIDLNGGKILYALPSNVGPRTMPDYNSLFQQGIYDLGNGMRVFAGTVDDPFYIDLGAAFDSLNFRMGVGGVMSEQEDNDDKDNFASDAVAGFNVNSIVLEVPITMLTQDGQIHPPDDKLAVIGTYGATSRQKLSVRRSPNALPFVQVQREGNPLINELIIGTGSKDTFSISDPAGDSQFANFVLDPLLAQLFASLGIPVPPPPRNDLLLLVQYEPPICPGCGPNDCRPRGRSPTPEHWHSSDAGGPAETPGFSGRRQCGISQRTPTDRRRGGYRLARRRRHPGGPGEVWNSDRRWREHQRRGLWRHVPVCDAGPQRA